MCSSLENRVRHVFDAVVVKPQFVCQQLPVTLANALMLRDRARQQLRGHDELCADKRQAINEAPSLVTREKMAWCMDRLPDVCAGVQGQGSMFFTAASTIVYQLYDEIDPLSLGTVLGLKLKPSSNEERLAILQELAVLFTSIGRPTDAIDRKCMELQAATAASRLLG